MENDDINYLINNSQDSIKCVDCINNDGSGYLYKADFIFTNFMEELMNLDSLSNKEYSIYRDDEVIRITYSVRASGAPEGAYNIVFLFDNENDKYLFGGMITVP